MVKLRTPACNKDKQASNRIECACGQVHYSLSKLDASFHRKSLVTPPCDASGSNQKCILRDPGC